MVITFSQTLESRQPDFFRLFMSGILLTAPLVVLWAWWLFSVPISEYKTSLLTHVTANSWTGIKLSDKKGGTVRAHEFITRQITARFSDTLPDVPPVLSVAVVNRYPHDRKAFTQGLAWDRGTVYEGTGLYGRSSLRRVDLESGRVKQQREYNRQIFAEGVTIFQDTVYQLTWKNNLVFQYSKNDLSRINSWKYPRQGWGLTHDDRSLIASNGTADLFFLDPKTLGLQRRITVHDDQGEVARLNELEYIKGLIYANVWVTERIALISPETGTVTAWLDLSPLCKQIRAEDKQADVLNGIMYDPAADRLFVTGKLWPALFEIRVVPTVL